jgi:DNA gyrase subunit A
MSLADFSRPRQAGINALELNEGDRLTSVVLASEADHVMIGTRQGQANRFPMGKFRRMGRGTRGVRGINLQESDSVIGMIVVETGIAVLTVTENGSGKRSDPDEYRVTGRGGKGVRNLRITEKTGAAVCLAAVREDQELLVITRLGTIIRMAVADINVIGRDTQGVRVIRLDEGDTVIGVTIVEKDDVDPSKLEADEEARASAAAGAVTEGGPASEGDDTADAGADEDCAAEPEV